jgi:hypothetical protein
MSQVEDRIALPEPEKQLRSRFWIVLLFAVIVSLLTVFTLADMWANSGRVTLSVGCDAILTNESALIVSEVAIRKAGLDDAQLQPAKFDGRNYFAQNIHNPSRGYVTYRWIDGRNSGYTVYMEQFEHRVKCTIVRNK